MELNVYEKDILLDQAQHEIFVHLLPVIVFLIIAAFVGILGNIFTVVYYISKCKRSPSTIQIACLASTDLVVCCMIIPHVIEMDVNVKHNQRVLCKLTKFFGMWSISSSCLILWMIALNRYRRLCRPFEKQIKVKTTVYFVVGVVVFSLFLSVRNFVNFDNNRVNIPVPGSNETVSGLYCTTRDDPEYKISVYVFHIIDFLLLLMILITIVVCYTRIICTLLSLNRAKKRTCPSVHADPALREEIGEIEDTEENIEVQDSYTNGNSLDSESVDYKQLACTPETTKLASSNSITDLSHSQPVPTISGGIFSNHEHGKINRTRMNTRKRTQRRKIAARSASERNLTFMMFTVSFLFILCFSPYFVVKIIMRLVLKSGEEFELSVGIQFALRLVYLNSVFNPIVYCFFNPQFRRYIRDAFSKCLRCKLKD